MKSPEGYYKGSWDNYYESLKGDLDKIPWDVPVQSGIELDLPFFQSSFNNGLPVIDFGCGVGRQTVVLADLFDQVVGVDVSKEAIQQAKSTYSRDNIKFEVLDAFSKEGAEQLHSKIGDANIYMRGVLQQVLPLHRKAFTESLLTLLGDNGILYLTELTVGARSFFVGMEQQGEGLTSDLKKVIATPVTRMIGVDDAQLKKIFDTDRFEFLNAGEGRIYVKTGAGKQAYVPSVFAMIKRRTP